MIRLEMKCDVCDEEYIRTTLIDLWFLNNVAPIWGWKIVKNKVMSLGKESIEYKHICPKCIEKEE